MNNKITVHTNIEKSIVELFDRQYKSCRTRFIQNAMKLACSDRNLFDKIFFCDLLSTSDVVSNIHV